MACLKTIWITPALLSVIEKTWAVFNSVHLNRFWVWIYLRSCTVAVCYRGTPILNIFKTWIADWEENRSIGFLERSSHLDEFKVVRLVLIEAVSVLQVVHSPRGKISSVLVLTAKTSCHASTSLQTCVWIYSKQETFVMNVLHQRSYSTWKLLRVDLQSSIDSLVCHPTVI